MANALIDGEWSYADIERPGSAAASWTALSRMGRKSGRSAASLLREFLSLKYGTGKLTFEEYAGLRLYDDDYYAGADKAAFIGFKALRRIWLKANYRFDYYGLVNNKIATDILLGTYGLPIMPTVAIFHENRGMPSSFLLRSEEELRAFLLKPENYPLFGKPLSGHQSLGTASLDHYDPARFRLITTAGYAIPLETFIGYVKAHAASGYIFQMRVSPHAQARAICGNRLATVRLLTIMTRDKPQLLRACWKIPAGTNVADNFWRPGNVLAQIECSNGRILSAVRANEGGFQAITHHPDTGAAIVGAAIPNWEKLVKIALEGAQVLKDIALMGWDVAPVDAGGILVEANETPDFKLHQLADRRGLMDAAFKEFIAEREQHAAQWLHAARNRRKVVTELVPPPSTPSDTAA